MQKIVHKRIKRPIYIEWPK